MKVLTLGPVKNVKKTDLKLPGSKSITNRALLLAALSEGTTRLHHPLVSDDSDRMIEALKQLGYLVKANKEGDVIEVVGNAGFRTIQPQGNSLFLGNAGTAMRPLAAALCIAGRRTADLSFYLHGEPRMHQRPIGDLVDALQTLGANIRYTEKTGYPPLQVKNTGLQGGRVKLNVEKSSQYITALLMAAPFAKKSIEIEMVGKLVSQPYIEMTTQMMHHFGVAVAVGQGWRKLTIPTGLYRTPGDFTIEGDASSASYFLAAGAIGGGPVRVRGVGRSSLQGDAAFGKVLAEMGARVSYGDDWIEAGAGASLSGVDLDLNHMPDAAMTLAITALFADSPTHIRNIANWRIKETDRLQAMATELSKVGAKVEKTDDSLKIWPQPKLRPAEIATYNDHRMAMSFSLAALGNATIRIQDPDCVRKTFPGYFEDFARLCG